MIKLIVIIISLFSLETLADSNKDKFDIQCQGNFAILGLNKAKNLSYPEIKKIAKTVCDKAIKDMDNQNMWSKLDNPMFFGCYISVVKFIEIFDDPPTVTLDKKSLVVELCGPLKGR